MQSTALSFIMGLLVWISVRQLEKPCPRVALGKLRSALALSFHGAGEVLLIVKQ